jgi:nucleotide-binding universal stress UspA family protein
MTTQAKTSQERNRYVVIVGVDFSDASAGALDVAAELAERAHGAELHLVHVVPVAIPPAFVGATGAPELGNRVDIQECSEKLKSWLEPLQGRRIRLAGHVRVGSPDREIAQVASDLGADLIVVGAQGKRGLERLLLGSVAESLVRSAPCAVLAHRPRTVPVWEKIEPPCADCVAVQQVTQRTSLWCERHSQHHARAHTYHEVPESYGVGSQTLRS